LSKYARGFSKLARIGRYDKSDQADGIDNLAVVNEIPHPQFEASGYLFDFMILEISGLSNYTVLKLNSDSVLPEAGQKLYVAGFGNTAATGNRETYPQVLQEVSVKAIPNNECELSEGPGFSYRNLIKREMLCAADKGADSCQGDSGAPLILKADFPEDDVQVGIVSW
jgi:hypothetical protein